MNVGPVYIFTWDGKRITVGQVAIDQPIQHVPRIITLDDGAVLCVSANTALLARNGQLIPAREAAQGASLLPLYLKNDKNGFWYYQEPGDWHREAKTLGDSYRWRCVSRMVAEWKMGRRCMPGDLVKYKNKDRSDCSPENLDITKGAKRRKRKAKFAEPIFEAARFVNSQSDNHKIADNKVGTSSELLRVTGKFADNLSVNGIFLSVDVVGQ